MNVGCPECQSVFRVDPAKVPAGGVRARCAVCGAVLTVGVPTQTPATVASDAHVVGASAPASGERAQVVTPAGGQPTAPPLVHAPEPPTPGAVSPELAASDGAPTPSHEPATAPDAAEPLAGAVSGTERAEPLPAPAEPEEAIAPAPEPVPAVPRRPVNPYLSTDPGQKARRLARALVSDLVAYHPQRREEGLRTGALKALFREEIRKSYDEYVEQVGPELAESTPYFRDALNDVLAGGRKVF